MPTEHSITFVPEPLVPQSTPRPPPLTYSSVSGCKVLLDSNQSLINFSSCDYFNLSKNKSLLDSCSQTLNRYGVGSCGPRGFYGTTEVHLNLESEIAAFYDCTDAVLYPLAHAAAASVLPCFASRGDIVFLDEFTNSALKTGVRISRADFQLYRHGDYKHLESLLQQDHEAQSKPSPKRRKWIVVESISRFDGHLVSFSSLLSLAQRYKCRVLVDETLAIGVHGPSGKGILFEQGFTLADVDLFLGSLEYSFGSLGGFCLSHHQEALDHQRLAAYGYVFSASVPPYLVTAALTCLQITKTSPHLREELQSKSRYLHEQLVNVLSRFDGSVILSGIESNPFKSITIQRGTTLQNEQLLHKLNSMLQENGFLLAVDSCNSEEFSPYPDSLKVIVSVSHSYSELDKLCKSFLSCMSRLFV
ncbi:hypothetical protein P9112_001931 [Eukaryota sp. TZLM1-RC]